MRLNSKEMEKCLNVYAVAARDKHCSGLTYTDDWAWLILGACTGV